ncbi:hypothetical protein, partial [Nocardiopsis changdeensis]|uniref:hypothetical protein n=1 Tax=Nocardiopsis changdeensis TaxID=2831969 RepID=UPI003F47ACDE
ADVAAAQARRLLDLAAEARDRLRDLHHGTARLDEDALGFLRTWFGTSVAGDLADPSHRHDTVARLHARFNDMLGPQRRL